jgi:hypothetical protein
MNKARLYKQSDLKKLFTLSGNNCSMPSCNNNLISDDGNTVLAKICHIEAASENGPRWNSQMNDDSRRDFMNLILMCSNHHDEIDNKINLKKYSVEYLKKIKKEHEKGNRNSQFVINEEHLNQLYNQLEIITEAVTETNIVVKQSSKVLKDVEIQNKQMLLLMQEMSINLSKIKRENSFPNDKEVINNFVNKTLDFKFNWVDSDKMNAFQIILSDYNETILSRREKFIFCQNIIQAMFNISELKKIINTWEKDSWNPENLDHLSFIQGGIMAYKCLEQIHKDIINDFRLLNWSPIHYSYYNGYLGSFIRELKFGIDKNIDLVKTYKYDRYLFENITRIFTSLKRFLEFDVNKLYSKMNEALITEHLPKHFLILNTSRELTIRDIGDFENILARLPLNELFRVQKTKIIRSNNKILIIGYSARECFYWNPQEDITSKIFYKTKENEQITNLFCELTLFGNIDCKIQIGEKLIQYIDFKEKISKSIESGIKLIRYENGFIGIPQNTYSINRGILIYSVKEDFSCRSLLTMEELNEKVRQDNSINNWLKSRGDIPSFLKDLQSISIQKIIHNNKDFLLIKGSILTQTSVLILLSIYNDTIEFHNIIHLKKSMTITIDSRSSDNKLDLCCGYLDLDRKNHVFEFINLIDMKLIKSKTIVRKRNEYLGCRDIFKIHFGDQDIIYLIEEGKKLLKYSISKNKFIEFLIAEETINDIKFI